MNKASHRSNYYYCRMHPEIHYRESGMCSICGIVLEPFMAYSSVPAQEDQAIASLQWRFWFASLFTIIDIFLHLFSEGLELYITREHQSIIDLLLATCVVFGAGQPILYKAFRSFMTWKLNMFSLLGAGICLAYFYSAMALIWYQVEQAQYQFLGLYFEPSMLMTTLILLGQVLEAIALRKLVQDVSIVENLPKTAHLLLLNDEERKITVEDVKQGDRLRVKPGEKVPVDGWIQEGEAWLDEAIITGEEIPVFKKVHDKVMAGTVNGNSVFILIADRISEETIIGQMLHTALSARLSQVPLQNKIDSLIAWLILSVFCLAGLVLIGFTLAEDLNVGISHAIAVLIIASPCALSLSASLPIKISMREALRYGILIKEAASIETLSKISIILLDKTGTLTEGKPLLTKVIPRFPFTDQEVLKLGASVEAKSDHPIAQAIVLGAKFKQLSLLKISHFQKVEGQGVIAKINGSRVIVGNNKILEDHHIDPLPLLQQAEKLQKECHTVVFVAFEYRAAGLLAVADAIKFNAERAILKLHQAGLKVILLTGDSKEVATAIGKRLAIDEIHADLMPQEKLRAIQVLQEQGLCIAVAGNGSTDAAVFSQADIAIALGTGFNTTRLKALMMILKGDLQGMVRARILSETTMCNVRQNIVFSCIYHLVAIPLAAGLLYPLMGVSASPIIACLATTLCSLCVVGNALRLRSIRLD